MTIVNTRLLGGVRIEKTDQNGQPLAGACFSIGGVEVCDNAEGDTNGDDGVIEVSGIPTGAVDIVETVAPEGYVTAGGATVEVVADSVVTAAFSNVRLVGTVRIVKTDENGGPLGGSCFSVGGTEVCDNGDGDLNPDGGIIEVGSVPTGTVDVAETSAPEGYTIAGPAQVEVVSNETAEITISNARAIGAISISKSDQDGNPLAGSCFTINGTEFCDNGDLDENEEPGQIDVSNLPSGSTEVIESTTPTGYAGADPQTIDIPVGDTASVSFTNTRILSSVSITKTDGNGSPLGGACFTVGERDEICDNGDGDLNAEPGIIEIDGVPTGSVTVVETVAPGGYLAAGEQTVEVVEGETASVTFVNERATGSLTITKTDADGAALGGACFAVGELAVCDDAEGDGNGEPGTIEISGIPTGSVEVSETTVPEGYLGAPPQTVEIIGDEPATLTFVNERATGSLTIIKTDADGAALGGACFAVGELA
ncbi:MAG: SpaA isopeptide-forming pilin-related protein, partial [Thermomicrobiales bacterium]